jgi:hypothetical protein
MSHVDILDFTIRDFDALKKACDILGAEIVMNGLVDMLEIIQYLKDLQRRIWVNVTML